LFGSAGIAGASPNPIPWDVYIGVAGSSPIAGRRLDAFGIAYYYMGLSDKVKDFAPRVVPLRDEQAVELFDDLGITPWCHLSPDLQVVRPATERNETALILGLRLKIDF
jgi:porin